VLIVFISKSLSSDSVVKRFDVVVDVVNGSTSVAGAVAMVVILVDARETNLLAGLSPLLLFALFATSTKCFVVAF